MGRHRGTNKRNMAIKQLTQHQLIFYLLLKAKDEYKAPGDLIGPVKIIETDERGYISYEANSRLTEIVKQNPDLLVSRKRQGKNYLEYKVDRAHFIGTKALLHVIEQKSLRDLYNKIVI